jgi:hypothetical protein
VYESLTLKKGNEWLVISVGSVPSVNIMVTRCLLMNTPDSILFVFSLTVLSSMVADEAIPIPVGMWPTTPNFYCSYMEGTDWMSTQMFPSRGFTKERVTDEPY